MTAQPAQHPIFVRVCRSQEAFGVHRSTVYRWAAKGWIRIYKRGHVSVVRLAEVEAMFENEDAAEKVPARKIQ